MYLLTVEIIIGKKFPVLLLICGSEKPLCALKKTSVKFVRFAIKIVELLDKPRCLRYCGQQVTEVITRAFNMFYLCFSFTLFQSPQFVFI